VLEVEDLAVTFRTAGKGEFPALRGVSLTLHSGEILGVVGESGSGKTTLGRCITGFVPPTAGTVTVDLPGIPASAARSVGRPGVQMVFQEASTSLNPRLPLWRSVAEALTGGRSTGRGHREAAIAELQKVGLTRDQAVKRPAEVSGGQRQRAAIARALASGAQILVCDEAVASLDVSVRARILNLLLRLRRERGTSIIFISHDMGVVAHLADRIVVMKDGRVEESGPSDDVIGSPGRQYTRELVAAIPRLEREG
jgi:peptide/nickel transport system ATP-binding protein